MATNPLQNPETATQVLQEFRRLAMIDRQIKAEAQRISEEAIQASPEMAPRTRAAAEARDEFGRKWQDNPDAIEFVNQRTAELNQQMMSQNISSAFQAVKDAGGLPPEYAESDYQDFLTDLGLVQAAASEVAPLAVMDRFGLDPNASDEEIQAAQRLQETQPSLPARDRQRALQLERMTDDEFAEDFEERSATVRRGQEQTLLNQLRATRSAVQEALAAQTPEEMEAFIRKLESDPNPQRVVERATLISNMEGFQGFGRPINVRNPDGSMGSVDFDISTDESFITYDTPQGEVGFDPGTSRSRQGTMGELDEEIARVEQNLVNRSEPEVVTESPEDEGDEGDEGDEWQWGDTGVPGGVKRSLGTAYNYYKQRARDVLRPVDFVTGQQPGATEDFVTTPGRWWAEWRRARAHAEARKESEDFSALPQEERERRAGQARIRQAGGTTKIDAVEFPEDVASVSEMSDEQRKEYRKKIKQDQEERSQRSPAWWKNWRRGA